jgi:DNA-binding MurR/RpiR family transcriptional regulator
MESSRDILNVIRQKRKTLSKGQKRIADYVLENYEKAAFMTASDLGKKAKVSESTVVRFAAALGFSGYPEFVRQLSDIVQEKIHSIERIEIGESVMSRAQILSNVMKADADKILLTQEKIDAQAFEMAVSDIQSADSVYIIGLRSCHALASFLAYYLKLIRKNVVLLESTGTNEILEEMIHVGSGDVVVGISFPRYSMATLRALEFANERNAKIIAITDSSHSPMNMYSSCNLLAKSSMASVVDSLAAPLSVINALIVALCMEQPQEVLDNLSMLEDVLNNYQTGDNDNINLVNDDAYEELKRLSGNQKS